MGLASKWMTRREAMRWGAIALLAAAACRKKSRVSAPGAPPSAKARPAAQAPRSAQAQPQPAWQETGIASWYGIPYHGRRAANGEIYDMNQLTAAHRTLPFGSLVMVTSLTNNKSVSVRITDRGPFVDGRIIDLSREAARRIDMIGPGIMQVKLELTGMAEARVKAPQEPVEAPEAHEETPSLTPAAVDQGSFAVQVGVFNDKTRAERLKANLEKSYTNVDLVPREAEHVQWRVVVGNLPTQEDAQTLANMLRKRVGEAMVVRRDLP